MKYEIWFRVVGTYIIYLKLGLKWGEVWGLGEESLLKRFWRNLKKKFDFLKSRLLKLIPITPFWKNCSERKKINQFSLWEMFWGYFCDSKLPIMKFNNQPFLRCQLAHTAHSAKFGGFFCLCTTGPHKWLVVKFHSGQFWVTEISPKHFPKAELVGLFFPLSNPSRKGCIGR